MKPNRQDYSGNMRQLASNKWTQTLREQTVRNEDIKHLEWKRLETEPRNNLTEDQRIRNKGEMIILNCNIRETESKTWILTMYWSHLISPETTQTLYEPNTDASEWGSVFGLRDIDISDVPPVFSGIGPLTLWCTRPGWGLCDHSTIWPRTFRNFRT